MNIVLFEAKASAKSLVIWTAALVVTLGVFLKGVFPIYMQSRQELEIAASSFPPGFLAAFGMDLKKMFSFPGFFSFGFTYIGLIGAILAVNLGISVFGREKRTHSEDFLLVKPRTRSQLFVSKLVFCLGALAVINLLYIVSLVLLTKYVSPSEIFDKAWALSALTLLWTQLFFLALGALYAVMAKRIRSVAGAATAFGMGAFILSALSGVLDKEILTKSAPLKFFSPAYVFEHGGYDLVTVTIAVVVGIGALGAAYLLYTRRDAKAV